MKYQFRIMDESTQKGRKLRGKTEFMLSGLFCALGLAISSGLLSFWIDGWASLCCSYSCSISYPPIRINPESIAIFRALGFIFCAAIFRTDEGSLFLFLILSVIVLEKSVFISFFLLSKLILISFCILYVFLSSFCALFDLIRYFLNSKHSFASSSLSMYGERLERNFSCSLMLKVCCFCFLIATSSTCL